MAVNTHTSNEESHEASQRKAISICNEGGHQHTMREAISMR